MRLSYPNPNPLPWPPRWLTRRCVADQSYQTYNSITTRAFQGEGCVLPGNIPNVYSASPRDWANPAAGMPRLHRTQMGYAPFADHLVSPFSSRDNSNSARLPVPGLSQRNDSAAFVALP